MLRYAADRKSIAFAVVHLAGMGAAFAFAPRGALGWLVVAIVAFSAFVELISTHNAMHSPIFVNRTANRLWQCMLSLTFTYPASVMVPVHNVSHHLHLQTDKDVLRTTDLRHRYNLLNLLHHVLIGTVHVHVLNVSYARAARKKSPKWFAHVLVELAVVLSVAAVLIAVDWKAFLQFVLLPSVLGQSMIIGLGFSQHDGCDAGSAHNHSRNFVGPVLNWLIFDNGFHTIHHDKPGLHWSLARAEHERLVVPAIAPRLNEASILRYIVVACILPGGRIRYDGSPVARAIDHASARAMWLPAGARAVGASSGAVEG